MTHRQARMHTRKRCQSSFYNSLLLVIVVFSLGSCSLFKEMKEPYANQTVGSEGQRITRVDAVGMREYRDSRLAKFIDSLSRSNLSKKHQELLAHAFAKAYVGVPVSTYTVTSREVSKNDEVTEKKEQYRVSEAGYLQEISDSSKFDLRLAAPCIGLPPPSFVPESGQLLSSVMAKAFVGIPISTYTEIGRIELLGLNCWTGKNQ